MDIRFVLLLLGAFFVQCFGFYIHDNVTSISLYFYDSCLTRCVYGHINYDVSLWNHVESLVPDLWSNSDLSNSVYGHINYNISLWNYVESLVPDLWSNSELSNSVETCLHYIDGTIFETWIMGMKYYGFRYLKNQI
jgi:hypothetical protein